MLTLPDLNKLKVFYVVYKYGSLIRAAESLNITRSAVSQALKSLEGELGTKLFIRDSKKVLSTEPAQHLYHSLEPFFTDLSSTMRMLETGKKEAVGHLRIGSPQDFGSTHLTDVIIAFKRLHPAITFELILETPVRLLERLSAGQLDLAFIDNGDFHAKNYPVSIMTVLEERFIPVCSRKYFEKKIERKNPSYSEFKDVDFIDYLIHGPIVKMWMKYQFRKIPSNLKIKFSAESVRALIRAAEGDLGVAIVPEHLVEDSLKMGRLKNICPNGREFINKITLTRRLERPVTARERVFAEFYKNFSGKSI